MLLWGKRDVRTADRRESYRTAGEGPGPRHFAKHTACTEYRAILYRASCVSVEPLACVRSSEIWSCSTPYYGAYLLITILSLRVVVAANGRRSRATRPTQAPSRAAPFFSRRFFSSSSADTVCQGNTYMHACFSRLHVVSACPHPSISSL